MSFPHLADEMGEILGQPGDHRQVTGMKGVIHAPGLTHPRDPIGGPMGRCVYGVGYIPPICQPHSGPQLWLTQSFTNAE